MKSESRKLKWRLPTRTESERPAQGLGTKGRLALYFLVPFLSAVSFATWGATNPGEGDELPPLRPPRAEIPVTFWEQYRFWIIGVGVFLLGIICVVVWVLSRPKPPSIVPPAVKAREALNGLRNQPETGELLSKISQFIRSSFT